MKQNLYVTNVQTALGEFSVLATQKGICWIGTPGASLEDGLAWVKKKFSTTTVLYEKNEILSVAAEQLQLYCSKKVSTFSCALDVQGTSFQKAVWQELQKIPFGLTTTYGVIAKNIGLPRASRAVGAAIGANPLPILVPCHRVIGSNGTLTGYRGGLEIKKKLLNLEQ